MARNAARKIMLVCDWSDDQISFFFMDPLEQSGNRDKRNRDRRVTQTTQAGREAKFKAITQKNKSRPLLMQGHHTEPSNRVMKYRRQQKQRNRDKRNRDRRVTQTTQAGREAQFKAITQKHNSRPLLMQGHHTEQSSRVMKYSQAGWWNTGGSRSRDKRVTQRTKTSTEALFMAITQSRLSQRVIMQGNNNV